VKFRNKLIAKTPLGIAPGAWQRNPYNPDGRSKAQIANNKYNKTLTNIRQEWLPPPWKSAVESSAID
jgi:hypothetical protein